MDQITDFWAEQYLDRYISRGGSKIKFITGGPGRSKSDCLREFLQNAAKRGYKTAEFSARKTWVHDFKEIYAAVLEAVDLDSCLAKCAGLVIKEMGFDPSEVSEGMNFADYLTEKGQFDPITRRELRSQINAMFYKNKRMDSNFAVCMSLLTGNILGRPALEPVSRELLSDWLRGFKGVRITELRKLGMSSSKVTKYNARNMLRSLAEVIKTAGSPGLVVGVDDLEALVDSDLTADIRYTKLRREDAYESIRELIDDIDSMSGVMFVFAFNKKLLENEKTGFKSYQALWMRIQNEVEGERVNRFADIVDMDRTAAPPRAEASEPDTGATLVSPYYEERPAPQWRQI